MQENKRKHRCLECGAEFETREQLDQHNRTEHREQAPGSRSGTGQRETPAPKQM